MRVDLRFRTGFEISTFQWVLLINLSHKDRYIMGLNGRKKILNEFSSASINKEVVNVWKELYSRN